MAQKQVVRYIRKKNSNRGAAKQRERMVQRAFTRWMNYEYPDVVFFNDWASGAYLTYGQNSARASLSCRLGWVDVFIAQPSRGFHGMFAEIKREDFKVYLKDGVTLRADPQLRKEKAFLDMMEAKGFYCVIPCGLDDLKQQVDWYLNRKQRLDLEVF